MRPPDRRGVGTPRVGGKVISIAVAPGAKQDGIRRVGLQFAGDEISRNNPLRPSVRHHQIQHLMARKHLHAPLPDLPAQGGVGSQQQLLPGRTPRIEGA